MILQPLVDIHTKPTQQTAPEHMWGKLTPAWVEQHGTEFHLTFLAPTDVWALKQQQTITAIATFQNRQNATVRFRFASHLWKTMLGTFEEDQITSLMTHLQKHPEPQSKTLARLQVLRGRMGAMRLVLANNDEKNSTIFGHLILDVHGNILS